MLALHIGLPKTATTFLQSRVFRPAPGLALAHRGLGSFEKSLCDGLRNYVVASGLRAWLARRRLAGDLASFAARAEGRPVVVSNENVVISSTSFWLGEGPSPEQAAKRLAALSRRLDADLRPVRIIIGVRRQDQWLGSRYAESSKHFPAFGQADFNRRLDAIAAAARLDGPLAWLDHDRVRRAFAAELGADNLFMLPLERLEADEAGALGDLGRFIGVSLPEPNMRPAGRMRGRNQLAKGTSAWRLRRDGSTVRVEPAQAAALRARFAASNAALAASGTQGIPAAH